MRWRAFSLLVLLIPALVACRTECEGDVQASKEQIAREQKAFDRGREGGICKELAHPRLTLTDDRLLLKALKENEIAHRNDIADDKIAPIEPLEKRLRMYRDHFRQVRAAEVFQPILYVTLDPNLSTTRAANILQTAARAGYTESRLYVGNETELAVRSSSKYADERPALCIQVPPKSDDTFDVYFDGTKKGGAVSSLAVLGERLAKICAMYTEDPNAACASVVALRSANRTTLEALKFVRAVLEAPPFVTRQMQTVIVFAADQADKKQPCAAGPVARFN